MQLISTSHRKWFRRKSFSSFSPPPTQNGALVSSSFAVVAEVVVDSFGWLVHVPSSPLKHHLPN